MFFFFNKKNFVFVREEETNFRRFFEAFFLCRCFLTWKHGFLRKLEHRNELKYVSNTKNINYEGPTDVFPYLVWAKEITLTSDHVLLLIFFSLGFFLRYYQPGPVYFTDNQCDRIKRKCVKKSDSVAYFTGWWFSKEVMYVDAHGERKHSELFK